MGAQLLQRLQQRVSLFWILQGGGWLAFFVAMSLSRMTSYPLWYMVINKGIMTLLGIAVTLGLRVLYRHLLRHTPSLLQLIGASMACSYLFSLVWTSSFGVSIDAFHSIIYNRAFEIGSWGKLLDGALYHAFVLMAWSMLYFGITYYHELQAERERLLKAEALAHQAQLKALRYQLHPHFLFNTLNAISTLVVEGENRSASRMIARLSEFLRLTLDSSGAQDVPLIEELEFVKRYLDIERVRFGDRLKTRIDVDPDTYAALVPNFILQPLVENAMRHAITPREEGGLLEIEARRVGELLHLRVRDDGPGLPGEEAEALKKGIGLANTQARLEERYGADHRFELRRADGGGLTVTLAFPFVSEPVPDFVWPLHEGFPSDAGDTPKA